MASRNNSPQSGLSTLEENDDETTPTPSSSGTTQSASNSSLDDRLTIQQKWKIDTALEKNTNVTIEPSRVVPVVKVIATFIFGSMLLFCVLSAKYSVLRLAQKLQTTEITDPGGRIVDIQRFILLFFYLVCPVVFNFLRSAWMGLLRKDIPWPSKAQVSWALLCSILESIGLCLFVFKIFCFYTAITSQLLLDCVFLFPSYQMAWLCYKNRNNLAKRQVLPYAFSAILSTFGTIFTVARVVVESSTYYRYIWHAVIAGVALSLAWCHHFVDFFNKFCTRDNTGSVNTAYDSIEDPLNAGNGYSTSGFVSEDASVEDALSATNAKQKKSSSEKSSFWKLGIVSNAFKLVFLCIFSFIIYFVDNECYSKDLYFSSTMLAEFKEAWTLTFDDLYLLIINVSSTIVGYGLGFLACHACMRKGAFAFPLLISVTVTPILLLVESCCSYILSDGHCDYGQSDVAFLFLGVIMFILMYIMMCVDLFNKVFVVLEQESNIFWSPCANGIALDQWLFINKRNSLFDSVDTETVKSTPRQPRVYICTTMYHETVEEMTELLQSIKRVNKAQMEGKRFFESHIVFDGGITNRSLSKYALQLIVLLQDTLDIKPENCTKVLTPYGMKLSWQLPSELGKQAMNFNIHLKDNLKVKNKKRWSQIMYMSLILDLLTKDAPDEECFILTTDADVKFTPDSVEALLDLLIRDDSVGAVCARTHPMGSGPLVWYQVFDYAIGHWFQKAAEHILGSVMCAPGCFSVYRGKAIKDVLPQYATTVEHAEDFLIKDMGEDRWLCTLLIQCGWRIEYCAAAENSTNCPDEFEEFFKQRRRWIVSTIANMMLILKKWVLIKTYNHQISILFLLYQGVLLVSSLIGPSTVIILVAGGLLYGWGIPTLLSILLQLFVILSYVIICLKAPMNVQINIARWLTFFYAVIMCVVTVGCIEQVVTDINNNQDNFNLGSGFEIPMSATTLYFAILVSLFTVTALFHPTELLCLFHGIWYLLCLPSGYIILNLYSICNLTDKSWGTREEKIFAPPKPSVPWYVTVAKFWRIVCFCCGRTKFDDKTREIIIDTNKSDLNKIAEDLITDTPEPSTSGQPDPVPSNVQDESLETKKEKRDEDPIPVEEWLAEELKSKYMDLFLNYGYDNTLFISALTKQDLEFMGITIKSHIHYLLDQIKLLPLFEIDFYVPVSVNDWLKEIGLEMYKSNFKNSVIKKTTDLQILKTYTETDVKSQLGILKRGHIKRLLYAVSRLRNPTHAERRAHEVKELIEGTHEHHLRQANAEEIAFWVNLIDLCLTPGGEAFSIESELKDALHNLRSFWLMISAVTNTLWLITIMTLATKADLNIFALNPLSTAFLVLFSIIFVIQFVCMVMHRFQTVIHFLARAPYRCGKPYKSSWRSQGLDPLDCEDASAISNARDTNRRANLKQHKRSVQRRYKHFSNDEIAPLIEK